MATKRTKADKAQRQADALESRSERRPAQVPKKTTTPEDLSQATARTVRKAPHESAAAILGHITPRKRDAAEGN